MKIKVRFFETKYLHILHQNIAGLLNKADALQVNLDRLRDSNKDIDVLCITEHNMMMGNEQNLNLENYTLASSFSRSNRSKGGACILVMKNHEWKEIPEIKKMSLSGIIECCAIELVTYKIIVICLYRIPKLKIDYYNIFFNKLDKILTYTRNIANS